MVAAALFCSVLDGGLDHSILMLLLARSYTMTEYVRGRSDWVILFGDLDGVRIIGLRDSRFLGLSPLRGPEAMIWACIRGGGHWIFSLKVSHEILVGCDPWSQC